MSTWNAMTPEGKDTILRVVRNEAEHFFANSGAIRGERAIADRYLKLLLQDLRNA